MNIERNAEAGTMLFLASRDSEDDMLAKVGFYCMPGCYLRYDGCQRGDDASISALSLYACGLLRRCAVQVTVRGDTARDCEELVHIRDICYWGTGGVIFLRSAVINGRAGIVITGGHCRVCHAEVIGHKESVWSVCASCAAKCSHHYDRGVVYSSRRRVEMRRLCLKCGRISP